MPEHVSGHIQGTTLAYFRNGPQARYDPAASASVARRAGLDYVSDSMDGIRRVRGAAGFAYVFSNNRPVRQPAELRRISSLAIPPAYDDVWICENPRGHLQATGRDARGRKQYRYHPEWRTARDGTKFQRMLAFGAALPRLRRQIDRDLAQSGLPRDKVLAVVISLLDRTRVRIGNAEYARDNSSYGLTTLRNRHVRFVGSDQLVLRFRGKGGLANEIPIADRRLTRLVRQCSQLPGEHLFQYIDEAGERRLIDSDQVNDYLKRAMGQAFTAKDFRTWGATLRALVVLRSTPLPEGRSERALAAGITQAIKQVAEELRNTPAVCRKSYVSPDVLEAWRNGAVHELIATRLPRDPLKAERPALRFMRRYASNKPGDSRALSAGAA
jgi:DNA topoisomerase-1